MIRLLLLSLTAIFLSLPFSGNSCCAGDQYVLTELLNAPTESRYGSRVARSIFIVQAESKSVTNSGGAISYQGKAKILEVYRGNEKAGDIINIGSGGNSSAGGTQLVIGKKYIVFSQRNKKGFYHAFVCDSFSRMIHETKKDQRTYSRQGSDIRDVVKKYFQFQKEKYTGKVSFEIDGKVIGKGHFKNGLPHGKWKHYNHTHRVKYLKSEIEYKNGKPHGLEKIYRSYQKNKLSKLTKFKEGQPIEITYYTERDEQYFKSQTAEIKYSSNNLERHKTTTFYPDGKIQKLQHDNFTGIQPNYGFYASKYRSGKYETYFPNGQLQEEGRFHLGAKIGKWKTYLEDGTVKEEKDYPKPDDSIAPFVLFFEEGNPRITGQLTDGKRTGEWKTFYKEGPIAQIATFQNDELYGLHQAFRLEEQTIYKEANYKKGILHGKYKTFQKNGKDLASIVLYKNGEKEGEEKQFFEDGKIRFHTFYKNGKLNGALVSYISPNVLYRKENYQNGLKHGAFENYTRDGKLRSKGNYEMGIQTGTWYQYYPDGKLLSKCEYSADHPDSQIHYSVPDSCEEFEKDGSPKKRKQRTRN